MQIIHAGRDYKYRPKRFDAAVIFETIRATGAVVNITQPEHPLHPGYVEHIVSPDTSGSILCPMYPVLQRSHATDRLTRIVSNQEQIAHTTRTMVRLRTER